MRRLGRAAGVVRRERMVGRRHAAKVDQAVERSAAAQAAGLGRNRLNRPRMRIKAAWQFGECGRRSPIE